MRHFKTMASCAILAAAASLSATSAGAVTLDFEDLANGPQAPGAIVYPTATFTSSTGQFYVNGAGVGKDLCTYNGSCDADLTVVFSSAVSNLSFTTAGDNSASTISYTVFFGAGGSVGGTFTNDGVFSSLDAHSFGSLSDIIKIEFSDDDAAGITYDNFVFDVGAAVPEPASWAMMIGGFALAGTAMRRRKAAVSFA